ncbi:MAG: hypothetical protein HY340_02975 [Candidatus Kerfeldbacteria bacterium]|nr:hypothetical protein [Candidatus Kerfeldbacteria bacterium]
MSTIKKLTFLLIVIGILVVAAYLFVWILALVLLAAPIAYLWWRWKVGQLKKNVRRRSEAITIEPTHHITE